MNDDVRSPGSGSTPGPLSAQPPPGLGDPDPGKFTAFSFFLHRNQSINSTVAHRSVHAPQLAFVITRDENLIIN